MDVIIISCGKTPTLQQITQNSVNSCLNSIGDFNIIVIETCKNTNYKNCKTLFYQPSGRFNYNRALNYGISQCTDEYIACCNNDLIFDVNWAKNIIDVFNATEFDSLSPFERNWHITWQECKALGKDYLVPGNFLYEGNTVRVQFTGWCYVLKRSAYNKIGGFNTLVEFYYSDNIVVEQYKKFGITHALVGNSFVNHILEQTWPKVLCSSNQRYFTGGQLNKFKNAKQVLWST